MGRLKVNDLLWEMLLYAALTYVFYCIFDTARTVQSTNAYIKSLDASLVRWMAEPRDSQSLPNS